MKVIIAPDKFKGTLVAKDVAKAIEAGIKKVAPDAQTVLIPIADGGEGTVDAILTAAGGARHEVVATGPLGESVRAGFGILPDGTAVIEMAQASGFALVPPDKRDPTVTTTYGTGELIEAALDFEARRFLIGIGGSATCDAGIGAAQALGIKIYREDGLEIGFGGAELIKITGIDRSTIDSRISGTEFLVASDVNNPLYGPYGAAHVFAPQKGASADQVNLLDQGLINFARVVEKDLGVDISNIPGGGAAGGLGAGLVAFLGASIKPGAELIIEAVGLREKIKGADLVITGEGQIDAQSVYGKAPVGVTRLAKKNSVKVVAIAGRLGQDYEKVFDAGVEQVFSLAEIAGTADEAMKNPTPYIEAAASRIAKEFLLN